MGLSSHKPFYFVRHGETDWNLKGITMGQTDIELNATGLKQAEKVAESLKDTKFGSIVTSPLRRSFQTAQIISKKTSIPLTIIDEFKEISLGSFQGKPNQLSKIKEWRNGEEIEGAESFSEFIQRVRIGLDRAFKLQEPILIVAHGGVYWAIQKILKVPFQDLPNCAAVYHRPPKTSDHSWFIYSLDEEQDNEVLH
jgi:probable phosphoglycerate mutase